MSVAVARGNVTAMLWAILPIVLMIVLLDINCCGVPLWFGRRSFASRKNP